MKKIFLALLLTLSLLTATTGFAQTPKWITAYHPTWWYGTLKPSMIDFSQMTHIAIFPAQDALATAPYFNASTIDDGNDFPQIVTLAHAKGVKILISVVGGYGQTQMPIVAADPAKCQAFVNAACAYAKSKNADGIELDWEFPQPADKVGWNRLIRLFRQQLDTWSPRGELATSMFYSISGPDTGPYQKDSMMVFDQINLMSYTMWMGTSAGPFTSGFDTPINPPSTTKYPGYNGWALNTTGGGPTTFITAGYPASKLGLGISFEGTRFEGVTTLGKAYTGWGFTSSVTNSIGGGYPSIPATGRVWDADAQANYAVKGTTVYSFQDTNSIKAIAGWAKAQNWGGLMIYDLGPGYDGVAVPHDALLKAAGKTFLGGTVVVPPPVLVPVISTPPTFTFGIDTVGTTSQGTLYIKNTGTAALTGTLSLPANSGYTINTTVLNVAVGATQSINVAFAPTAVKDYTVPLTIAHNAAGSPTVVTLIGNGVPAPVPLGPNAAFFSCGKVLSWVSCGARTITIYPGIGNVSANGSKTVYVTATTTYIFTATNAAGGKTVLTATVTK